LNRMSGSEVKPYTFWRNKTWERKLYFILVEL
jgi:hypothetical protein